MTEHAALSPTRPGPAGTSDPFAEMSTTASTPAVIDVAALPDAALEAANDEDKEELVSATADLRLKLLVLASQVAVVAVIILGLTGIVCGVLALAPGASSASATALQQRCLMNAVAAAICGMAAAAARAGTIDRRRRIARAIARRDAERARRAAARAREAARKAAAAREASEAAKREERRASIEEMEAREAELERERLAVVEAMEEAVRLEAERQADLAQRERERKATEERIERAIRDGTRAT